MKKLLFVFLFFPLFASDSPSIIEQDELEVVQELIGMTRAKLEIQENLLQLISHYKTIRTQFLEDPNSRKLATALVRNSEKIDTILQINQLSYLFNESFIKEIRFFSQVGQQAALRNVSQK